MRQEKISDLYSSTKTLSYHPNIIFRKRKWFNKLFAYDNRFEEVTKILTNLIKNSPESKKILDIGVGDAVYESLIPENLRRRSQFYGVDISKTQIKRAQKYLHEGKVVDLNSQKLPFSKNYFDIILISEILEHIFFPDHLLTDADKRLKPGGFMLITYPNSGALQLRLTLLFSGRSVMLNYPDNPQHIRFFQTKDILSMLGNNYTVKKNQGLSSFLFAKWNFCIRIPVPRILEVIGDKYLPNFALGNLLLVQKKP